MGIFDRLSTLIRSNINDLINRAEDPEKMLNQLIVDMRSQLAKAKQQVAAAIADEKRLSAQVDTEKKSAEDWERRAVLAVQEGRDDWPASPRPGGQGGRRPGAPGPETQAGAAPRRHVRGIQAARQGRCGSGAGRGRRRSPRAPPLNTEPSASRLSGATFVALFVAALAIWFVVRVVEVLLLVFIAVLCPVYLSGVTDVLERRFQIGRAHV